MLHFTGWDWALMGVVTAMSSLLAWIRNPAWKAFILGLPLPFTCATLSLGEGVQISNVAGLVVMLGYFLGVRVLCYRWRVPIVASIAVCVTGYVLIASLLNRLLPRSEPVFWLAALAAAAVGLVTFRRSPVIPEPRYRSPMPFWIKVPIIMLIVVFLVAIKKQIGGFMSTFPMVGLISAYEARNSLYSIGRQMALTVIGLAVMMALVHGGQRVVTAWLPPSASLGAALAIGWTFFLSFLGVVTRGRWTLTVPEKTAGLLLLVAGAWTAGAAEPAAAHFDGTGRLRLLTAAGEPVPVLGEIRVAGPAWSFYGASAPWSATGVTFAATSNAIAAWTGIIPLEHGGRARYEQRVTPLPHGADVSVAVTAESDFELEGLFYFLQFPISTFEDAQAALLRGTATVATARLTSERPFGSPAQRIQGNGVDRIRVQKGLREVRLRLDRPCGAAFQDDREWGVNAFSLLLPFGKGPRLRRDETARLRFTVDLEAEPDRAPVAIGVRAGGEGDWFEGFGGNFVYGLETPVATALVARLAPVRARIELALHEWEPVNDNADPGKAEWAAFEARDTPGSELRRRFELAALLSKRGVPVCASVWDLPEWMYEGPPRGRWAPCRVVAPALWPEVLECAGTYLAYLKNQYGVEPDLFSFNEPEAGVRVVFTAEEHRDAIRRFGAHFASLGLKTKQLVGDVSHPRGSESYGVYALSDPAAIPYIGAVAFHAWGGATPFEYASWPAFARRFNLPLYCMELGWDPGVWRTPHELETPLYAVQELKLIQDVLTHARPRAALLWEYSDDYPLLAVRRTTGGAETLAETPRYRFWEQMNRLTPRPARAIAATVSRADVSVSAFRAEPRAGGGGAAIVLHAANAGAARQAVITGLPAGAAGVKTETALAVEAGTAVGRVPVKDGTAKVDLPAWSLVTLTAEP